jgi:phosphoglycerate transport regulatory protein PgtC
MGKERAMTRNLCGAEQRRPEGGAMGAGSGALARKLGLAVVVGLELLGLCFTLPSDASVADQGQRLNILTSFPPDFYNPFIEAFHRRHPELQIQILNKKTTAAIAEIERGNQRLFDIFWSSSPDAFAVLKQAGQLRRSGYRPGFPPLDPAHPRYGDPEGYFFNFAFSGVGYMWNEALLKKEGIAAPTSWQDLADPRFYGQLAVSTPSRSGTTHMIVENILQAMGWRQGWRLILQASGNLETVTARSFSVPEGVANGRFSVGLVIDFLATAKSHSHKEIAFRYGDPLYLIPAGIALLEQGANPIQAAAFIDFILSPEGQKILLQPSIGRLPVSGALFTGDRIGAPPLLNHIRQGTIRPYDTELSRRRYQLVNALFDQLVTYRLLERRKIWKQLLWLSRLHGKKKLDEVRITGKVLDLICGVPVNEKESLDSKLNQLFEVTAIGDQTRKRRILLQRWDDFVSSRFLEAETVLSKAAGYLADTADD